MSQRRNTAGLKALPTAKRKNRRGSIVLICLLTLLAVAGVFAFSFIRADNITVLGAENTEEQHILDISGIKKGESVLSIDKQKIAESIAEDPSLRLRTIEFTFPNSIALVVEKRKPSVKISYGGNLLILDDNANVLEVLRTSSDETVPEVTGLAVRSFDVGFPVRTDDEFKTQVMRDTIKYSKKYGIAEIVEKMDFTNINRIVLKIKTGAEIVLGQSDRMNEKFAWIVAILSELGDDLSTGIIDVSSPGSAIFQAEPDNDIGFLPEETEQPNIVFDPENETE